MATRQERPGPLLLLDGMSLAFRAYFALPDTLATSSGVVTNAVHGFTSMLVYLIREQRPSALVVAFDAPGATFRDEILEDYKAGRAETPWLLPPQFDIIREVMAALAVPVVEAPGFEADDVIATLATEAAERHSEVVIVTGDRDSFQLVQRPLHPGALQQARRERLRPLRRGGHHRAHAACRPRSTCCWPRCAATPRTTCPACRAWERRPPPSSSPLTATSTASSRT